MYYMDQGGVDSRFPVDVLLIELVPEEDIITDSSADKRWSCLIIF
jgi:hypothetical protein